MTCKYANENFHDNSCRVKEKEKAAKRLKTGKTRLTLFNRTRSNTMRKNTYYYRNGNKTNDDSDSDVRHDALLQKEKAVKRMKTGQADSF